MEPTKITVQSIEDVDLPANAANENRLFSAVVELGLADLLAIDRLRDSEQKREGRMPSRSEVIRRAVQFYYERHQEVII